MNGCWTLSDAFLTSVEMIVWYLFPSVNVNYSNWFFFLLFLIKSKPAILENFVFWTERQKSRILILYQYTFIFIFSFYLFSSLALHPTWGSSSQPKIKSGTLYWLNQSYIPGGELYLIMMCFPFVYISRFNLSVFSLGFLTLCS